MSSVRSRWVVLATLFLLGLSASESPTQDKETRGEDDKKASAEIRKKLADIKAGKATKVYRTSTDLLADMPKDAFPKAGQDEGISRADARKWLATHLVLRPVEWQATVIGVSVSGDGPFEVRLKTDLPGVYDGFTVDAGLPDVSTLHVAFGDRVSLGGQDCRVTLNPTLPIDLTGVTLKYTCSRDEAKRLSELKSKKVTLRATVTEANLGDEAKVDIVKGENRTTEKSLPIALSTTTPSIDGFMPRYHAGQGHDLPFGVYTKDGEEGLILVLEAGKATVFDGKAELYACRYHKGLKLGEPIRLTGPFTKGVTTTDGSWVFEGGQTNLTIRAPNDRELKVFDELIRDADRNRVKLFTGKWTRTE